MMMMMIMIIIIIIHPVYKQYSSVEKNAGRRTGKEL